MQPLNYVEEKTNLLKKVRILIAVYRKHQGSRLSVTRVIKLVSSLACEKRILASLSANSRNDNKTFDIYFREKSAYATVKILDRIKAELIANNIEADLFTEAPADMGRYDILVSYPNSIDREPRKRIIIEIKASIGLEFEQIARYLCDPSPLILVRVMTKQVARLNPLEMKPFVINYIQELSAKIDRLTIQRVYAVPGFDCKSCLLLECKYRTSPSYSDKSGIISLSDKTFEQDLKAFLNNLSYVSDRTALIVLEELRQGNDEVKHFSSKATDGSIAKLSR